ncbi:carbohydrate kinase [Tropicibacter sp. Alg240-R139]|uniref:carbohydrate kinase family protein n=1 Tax=Tropicibacter sp. Alg240-R139 TaxID=2305991 RepID=UPI00210538EA|nr:carbohydrate kinase [Tropicibacter sp. Alg240-R139]
MAGVSPPCILCCGEAVMDLVPLADGSDALLPVVGGAAVNCAVALSRLGVSVGFVGALSTDAIGERIFEHLLRQGVDTSLTHQSAKPSTLAVAQLLPDGIRFTLFDENSAGRSITTDQLPTIPKNTQALVFGGISLAHAPAAAAFELMITRAGRRVTWLDLNIRPSVIGDAEDYRARLIRMIRLASVVKVSDEDLDWFGPLPDLRDDQLLLHTCGAAGAEARMGSWGCHVPAPKVEVRDTVGAGDTFNAGVLASLVHSDVLGPMAKIDKPSLVAAIAFGVRAASFSVNHAGAHAPTQKEIE